MTNLEKLIETLQNAPIEKTVCFIRHFDYCKFCIYLTEHGCEKDDETRYLDKDYIDTFYRFCEEGIKQYLESEVE